MLQRNMLPPSSGFEARRFRNTPGYKLDYKALIEGDSDIIWQAGLESRQGTLTCGFSWFSLHPVVQWYSTFFVCITPDVISQLCTSKVVGA
jgi:hypothetical protein